MLSQSKTARHRQNKRELKAAKESADLAKEIALQQKYNFPVPRLFIGLRFKTPLQFFVGLLLLSAVARNNKKVPICNSKVPISDKIELRFQCDEDAIALFKEEGNYMHTIDTTVAMISESIKQDHATDCKLQELSKNSSFSVTFLTKAECDANHFYGAYSNEKHSIYLPSASDSGFFAQSTWRHEVHHAWVGQRSNGKGIVLKPEDRPKFYTALNDGLNRFDNLINIINAKERNEVLNKNESTLLSQYENLARDYKPYLHRSVLSQNDLDSLIEENFANKQGELLKTFSGPTDVSLKVPGHKVYNFYVDRLFVGLERDSDETFIIHYYTVPDLEDKSRAALYDVAIAIEHELQRFLAPHREDEVDAYIHEQLERYPNLLTFLLPKLGELHNENNSAEYKACMRR